MATDPKAKPDVKAKIDSKPMVENKVEVVAKGKSHILLILFGALFLLLAGGVGIFAYYHYRGARPETERVKAMLPLDPFLVNLADTDEIRFVKTTFQLGLRKEPLEEDKNPAVIAAMRDAIISLLSSKTADQILTAEGKEKLRKEILLRVHSVAPKIEVLEVYIVEFVVQL